MSNDPAGVGEAFAKRLRRRSYSGHPYPDNPPHEILGRVLGDERPFASADPAGAQDRLAVPRIGWRDLVLCHPAGGRLGDSLWLLQPAATRPAVATGNVMRPGGSVGRIIRVRSLGWCSNWTADTE